MTNSCSVLKSQGSQFSPTLETLEEILSSFDHQPTTEKMTAFNEVASKHQISQEQFKENYKNAVADLLTAYLGPKISQNDFLRSILFNQIKINDEWGVVLERPLDLATLNLEYFPTIIKEIAHLETNWSCTDLSSLEIIDELYVRASKQPLNLSHLKRIERKLHTPDLASISLDLPQLIHAIEIEVQTNSFSAPLLPQANRISVTAFEGAIDLTALKNCNFCNLTAFGGYISLPNFEKGILLSVNCEHFYAPLLQEIITLTCDCDYIDLPEVHKLTSLYLLKDCEGEVPKLETIGELNIKPMRDPHKFRQLFPNLRTATTVVVGSQGMKIYLEQLPDFSATTIIIMNNS
ncbi:MAG TPA: hypothetical protein VD999_00250 [Vitreimonas sp.]|nr:hypothetical protein [Vitreimonas sp.]